MPVHRVKSGVDDPDLDILEAAITRLERSGEDVVTVLPFKPAYPLGEWFVVTRKVRERAVKPRDRAETRKLS